MNICKAIKSLFAKEQESVGLIMVTEDCRFKPRLHVGRDCLPGSLDKDTGKRYQNNSLMLLRLSSIPPVGTKFTIDGIKLLHPIFTNETLDDYVFRVEGIKSGCAIVHSAVSEGRYKNVSRQPKKGDILRFID